MASFDVFTWEAAQTIQSQYSSSPRITALINAFWECLKPKADIELIYRKLFDPRTAEGWGLDVWGRIVAVGRSFLAVDEDAPYFGFNPPEGVYNDRLGNMNNAPFYKIIKGKVELNDTAYRTYVFLKAMINIGDSTLASLNRMVKSLFPDADVKILHSGTMALRILILSSMSSADKTALLNLPWLPAGVGLEMYQVITPTLGFAGTGLQNFNHGTFATYTIEKV